MEKTIRQIWCLVLVATCLTLKSLSITIETIDDVPETSDDMTYIGNPVNEATLSQGQSGSYLLSSHVFGTGVVASFYMYLANDDPFYVQVWRLTSNDSVYSLVGQHYIEYKNAPALVKVTPSAGEYIFTDHGDILGFTYIESNRGPLGFTFSFSNEENVIAADPIYELHQNITDNGKRAPYIYKLGAMHDKDYNASKYHLKIDSPGKMPDNSTELQPGEKLLSNYFEASSQYVLTNADQTYIMTDMCLKENATLTSFMLYGVNDGKIALQIWRPQDRDQFVLMDTHNFDVTQSPGFYNVTNLPDIRIDAGSCIGFGNIQSRGIVGYKPVQTDLMVMSGTNSSIGTRHQFISVPLPYLFSVALTYKPEYKETTTIPFTTANGNFMAKTTEKNTEKDSESWLKSKITMTVCLIWLIVITVVLVFCGVYCCVVKWGRKEKATVIRHEQERSNGYENVLGRYERQSWTPPDDSKVMDFYGDKIIKTHMNGSNGNIHQSNEDLKF